MILSLSEATAKEPKFNEKVLNSTDCYLSNVLKDSPMPAYPDDTISAPNVEYELNYGEYSLPASLLVKPVVILSNGTLLPETSIATIEWKTTATDWASVAPEEINPDKIYPVSMSDLTASVWWRIKDISDNYYYTNGDVPQKIKMTVPPCGGDVKAVDVDGNEYETVGVGSYCWTKTNIKATHYSVNQHHFNAGDAVAKAMVYSAEANNDTLANYGKYGYLYTWYSAVGLPEGTADTANIPVNDKGHVVGVCPVGWYVPSTAAFLSILGVDAKDLRSNSNWIFNQGANAS